MSKVSQVTKEYIKQTIENTTDKTQLCELFKIIMDNNPNIYINKQSSSMYIDLNTITDETFNLINDYLRTKSPEYKQKIQYTPYNTDIMKFKGYNAEEKSLIEHVNYINKIKSNQS